MNNNLYRQQFVLNNDNTIIDSFHEILFQYVCILKIRKKIYCTVMYYRATLSNFLFGYLGLFRPVMKNMDVKKKIFSKIVRHVRPCRVATCPLIPLAKESPHR